MSILNETGLFETNSTSYKLLSVTLGIHFLTHTLFSIKRDQNQDRKINSDFNPLWLLINQVNVVTQVNPL